MRIEFAVHKQDIITLVLGTLNKLILRLQISGIQVNDLLILVSLSSFDSLSIFIETEVFAVSILQKSEIHGSLAELLV